MRENILKTLIWFDIFDYPLTAEEIFLYLVCKYQSLSVSACQRVKEELGKLVAEGKVEEKQKFYFLPGREKLIRVREERKQISVKKIKKARLLVQFFGWLPGVRAIFLCNTVGHFNADLDSDIDLFVITGKNRIWTARFGTAGILKLLRLRPTETVKRDKFCLSYFVTENNLNLEATRVADWDLSLIMWLITFWPLYDSNNYWESFKRENIWIKEFLVNFEWGDRQKYLIKKNRVYLRFLENSRMEKILKKWQLVILPSILKRMMNKDKKVIINDQMLKLHSADNREEMNERWQSKISNI